MLTYIVPQPGVTDFVELGIWSVKYLLTKASKKKKIPQNEPSSSENVNHIDLTLRAKENRQLDSILSLRISP